MEWSNGHNNFVPLLLLSVKTVLYWKEQPGSWILFWRSLSSKEKVDRKKIDKSVILVRHQVFHPEPSSVDGPNVCAERLSKGIENRGKWISDGETDCGNKRGTSFISFS
jgi:hypothetical protein